MIWLAQRGPTLLESGMMAVDVLRHAAEQPARFFGAQVIVKVDAKIPLAAPFAALPVGLGADDDAQERAASHQLGDQIFALGFIETQGFTAVFEAIDSACKAANVEVIGKEKLGGGYITVVVKGDVAAVKAAVEAGTAKVQGLGKLIAGHVIARPSAAVLSLLPKA